MAATKPVLVVPGLNQGNTINGVAPTARGDIGNPACVAEQQDSLKVGASSGLMKVSCALPLRGGCHARRSNFTSQNTRSC